MTDSGSYESKRQDRIERLRDRAASLRRRGELLNKAGWDALHQIPFGQPILIGHHSERRDRNYRNRATSRIDKGSAMIEQAKRLESRAESAASNRAIFSDDPNAVEKIEERIAKLEKRQALMVAANKLVRKQDREGLLAMGFSEKVVDGLFKPDFCGRLGFPDYALTNNSGNIRRLKQRVVIVTREQATPDSEREGNGIRLEDCPSENRVRLFFPGKPADTVRDRLKHSGFRWTPSMGCWQAYRNPWSIQTAQTFVTVES